MHFIEELAKQIRSRGPNSRTYVLVLNTFPCECTHAFKILPHLNLREGTKKNFADKKRLFTRPLSGVESISGSSVYLF